MRSRVKLQRTLEDFASRNDVAKVYFSPPANASMRYPCIVYTLKGDNTYWADGRHYIRNVSYEIEIITSDVDSMLPFLLADELRYCRFDRRFIVDNLTHYVLTCYVPLDTRA